MLLIPSWSSSMKFPVHTPETQESMVQALPSEHDVPSTALRSAGHALFVPSQFSATSQASTAGRHTLVSLPSAGQVGLPPGQVSTASQTPTAGRQTAPEGWKASSGQSALEPVQFSATSHPPVAAGRQTVLDDRKPSTGQVGL